MDNNIHKLNNFLEELELEIQKYKLKYILVDISTKKTILKNIPSKDLNKLGILNLLDESWR